MARVVKSSEAKRLVLPGRTAYEIVSAQAGARAVTFRRVEIPVPAPGNEPRAPHVHRDFEECIFVLSGRGATEADSGRYPLEAGDTILIPAGEKHCTRNTGEEPLVLLCFFPTADITSGSREASEPMDAS
jgi:mannose-6-phosphate isomerase-like protein (cupin superfamily)